MVLFNYTKLFSLKVLHNYYGSKTSGDLVFEPTSACASRLNKLGLRIKKQPDGFTVFSEVDEQDNLVRPLSGAQKLVFAISATNAAFYNFSDLPLDQKNREIFYFNNTTSNIRDVFGMGSQLLLHSDEQVSSSQILKIFGDVYRYELNAAGPAKTATLVNLDSGTISRTQEQDEVSGKFIFDILMEGLLPGRYRLDIDGLEKEVFYFDPELARRNVLGILEIFFTVPVSYRFFTGAGKADFKEYALAFQNRKTLWRYIIHNKNGILMPNPQIREATEPWTFTEDQPGTFISDSVMPLQENPMAGISLLAEATDPSSVLVSNLPGPDVTLIKPDINNISTIYSDVNVYI